MGEHTIVNLYSVGKAVTAVCALRLGEGGALDLPLKGFQLLLGPRSFAWWHRRVGSTDRPLAQAGVEVRWEKAQEYVPGFPNVAGGIEQLCLDLEMLADRKRGRRREAIDAPPSGCLGERCLTTEVRHGELVERRALTQGGQATEAAIGRFARSTHVPPPSCRTVGQPRDT
jgi:hypothetical protein